MNPIVEKLDAIRTQLEEGYTREVTKILRMVKNIGTDLRRASRGPSNSKDIESSIEDLDYLYAALEKHFKKM